MRRWLQKAVKRPGRTRKYLKRVYGSRAFTKAGTIKREYLDKALKRAEKEGNTGLVRALNLAKTLKRAHR